MAGTDSGQPVMRLLSSVGPRTRELTGAVDLVTYYGLQDMYNNFCKKPLPVSIADSPYLRQVVGHTELRKGEGVELGQLITGPSESSNQTVKIQTLDLQLLQWAFTLRETGPIELSEADKGLATICGNVKEEKEKKHKKKHRKHKHRDKDKDGKKDKDRGKGEDGEDRSKKHRSKKRKEHEGGEEDGKHKKRKHNHSSKVEAQGIMKNGK